MRGVHPCPTTDDPARLSGLAGIFLMSQSSTVPSVPSPCSLVAAHHHTSLHTRYEKERDVAGWRAAGNKGWKVNWPTNWGRWHTGLMGLSSLKKNPRSRSHGFDGVVWFGLVLVSMDGESRMEEGRSSVLHQRGYSSAFCQWRGLREARPCEGSPCRPRLPSCVCVKRGKRRDEKRAR